MERGFYKHESWHWYMLKHFLSGLLKRQWYKFIFIIVWNFEIEKTVTKINKKNLLLGSYFLWPYGDL